MQPNINGDTRSQQCPTNQYLNSIEKLPNQVIFNGPASSYVPAQGANVSGSLNYNSNLTKQ